MKDYRNMSIEECRIYWDEQNKKRTYWFKIWCIMTFVIIPCAVFYGLTYLNRDVENDRDVEVKKDPIKKDPITNGTTVLIFPEWTNSTSAFERRVFTEYYAVYSNKTWLVRERQPDGSLKQFWVKEQSFTDLDNVKSAFNLNMQWNIQKGIYDAFSK